MEVFILLLSLFAVPGNSLIVTATDQYPTVTYHITLTDGSSTVIQLSADEVANFAFSDFGINASEVVICVSQVAGWGSLCTKQAETCAEAIAATIQCIEDVKELVCESCEDDG